MDGQGPREQALMGGARHGEPSSSVASFAPGSVMAHSKAFIFAVAVSASGTLSCSELLGDVDIEVLEGAAGGVARAPDAALPQV